jgi:PAS domain S-box-containing protein
MRRADHRGESTEAAREIARQRRRAAEVLRGDRAEVLRRWMGKLRLLAREKGADQVASGQAVRRDAGEFLDLLLASLEGTADDADFVAFYHLILEGRQYDLRLADLAYALLELKWVAKQLMFQRIEDELEAFRVSRQCDDLIEGVLRKTADLYELTSEADYKTGQERLQEIFGAWELEEALADAQTTAEAFERIGPKLGSVWKLLGLRLRLYGPGPEPALDFSSGPDLPVPAVTEQHQYLTEREREGSGAIDVMESVRRRREPFICEKVGEDGRFANRVLLAQAGVESIVALPLVARDAVAGVVLMCAAAPGTFRSTDRRRLSDIAGVLGMALDRTRRLEVSTKEISEAEVIARIGRAVLELPSREELLKGVVEALRAFRDYFDVSLFRTEPQSAECSLVAEAGRGRLYRPADYRQKIGQGFIGLCAQSGETIRARNLAEDVRRHVAFEEEYLACCELAVPVKRGEEEVIGVLHILSDREEDFPEADIAALENVAPHIGVALQNARLIEEHRQDRLALERAHSQLTNIIRSTAVGITSSDPRGIYTHWSPSCEQILGYRDDEVIGRKSAADFAAEPYDLNAELEECRREGRITYERAMLRKDGSARIVRVTRVPLEDEQGRHVGFTSYMMDVTDQRRAEEALRRERDALSLVVSAMGAGLALFDRELRLRWANVKLMEWFGFGPEDYGKQCHDIYLCGRADYRACPTFTAAIDGRPQSRVHEYTDPAGIWHSYQQIFTPVEHGDTRLIALTFDITEQRRQTEQMRLITKLTEKIETSLDLERVMHLALTCVTAGHAIGFNRAFLCLLDQSGQWLEGTMAVGPLSPADAHRIWSDLDQKDQTIDELLDTAAFSDSDSALTDVLRAVRISMADGEDTLVKTMRSRTSAHSGDARQDPHLNAALVEKLGLEEFACVPLAVQEEPLGVMLADNKFSRAPITEYQVVLLEMFARQASLAIANARAYERIRRQLKELELARDRLISAERMASVGRMASHLAHEIRNPLTAIGGFASSIARRHQDDPRTFRNATIIYDEVCRLERTLVNVLDYTRPLRPEKRPTCINDVVRETVQQFETQLKEGNVEVELSLPQDVPTIEADPQMIKQVVINLVKNALAAMEGSGGGTLRIRTGPDADGGARMVVEDSGPGMEQEVMENLFSPFYTTRIGGIGLGLAVSSRIVEQHGGSIEVQSRPGAGSGFTVRLAAGREDANGQAREAAPQGQQKGAK